MFSLSRNKTNTNSKSLPWSKVVMALRVWAGSGFVTSMQGGHLSILGVVTSDSCRLLDCVPCLLIEPHHAGKGGQML